MTERLPSSSLYAMDEILQAWENPFLFQKTSSPQKVAKKIVANVWDLSECE